MAPLIAYIDSSVLLRIVLRQPNALPNWESIDVVMSSTLLHLEVTRTLDRLWIQRELTNEELESKTALAGRVLNRLITLDLDQRVVDFAAQPLPRPLGTLDALHLATAILYRQIRFATLVMATHDKSLARAARAMHFEVIGDN